MSRHGASWASHRGGPGGTGTRRHGVAAAPGTYAQAPPKPLKVTSPGPGNHPTTTCPVCGFTVRARKDGSPGAHRVGTSQTDSWPCPGASTESPVFSPCPICGRKVRETATGWEPHTNKYRWPCGG